MLQTFSGNNFTYTKVSKQEQERRHILGRLTGPIASTTEPTRNGRGYSRKLWEKVFEDPIMIEKIKNRCVFGELGHPEDRTEIDMEKAAICLAEVPKLGSDGNLYGIFDILDTPNGRILKNLCDYGTIIGVSSRGQGDLTQDAQGNEIVDPDTYDCECWDAVIVPAVQIARMKPVNESLNKNNKNLKKALKEAVENASKDDQRIMKDTLKDLNIDYSDDEVEAPEDIANSDVEDGEYTEEEPDVKEDNTIEGSYELDTDNCTPEEYLEFLSNSIKDTSDIIDQADTCLNKIDDEDVKAGIIDKLEKLKAKNDKLIDNLDQISGTLNSDSEEVDDEEVDDEDADVEDADFEDTAEISEADEDETEEPVDDEVEADSDEDVEEMPEDDVEVDSEEDNSDDLDIDNDLDVENCTPEEFVSFMQNYLNDVSEIIDNADSCIEKIEDGEKSEEVSAKLNMLKEQAAELAGEFANIEAYLNGEIDTLDSDDAEEAPEDIDDNEEETDEQETAVVAVDNGADELVDSLKESLTKQRQLEGSNKTLQKKLAASNTRVTQITEEVNRYKAALTRVSEVAKSGKDLRDEVSNLKESLKSKNAELQASKKQIAEQQERINRLVASRKANLQKADKLDESLVSTKKKSIESSREAYNLNEQLKAEKAQSAEKIKALNEQLTKEKAASEKQIKALNESVAAANKSRDSYKTLANNAVNKYIEVRALTLGLNESDIKRKLGKTFTLDAVDQVCEELKVANLNVSRLPFDAQNRVRVKVTEAVHPTVSTVRPDDDDLVDDTLLKMANLF